ncbi:hypothetical protein COV19_00190 [Candidatus Woesearchaeota archaeon CG10_big_fil_rev_8_21_14_0_10_44_13]|nr:MAG: hypothetical protein COV19_00190 [Candidatus Woesearchaeota archaeon CG10_big_fil_rev_8_21_14_0_10_44_13]
MIDPRSEKTRRSSIFSRRRPDEDAPKENDQKKLYLIVDVGGQPFALDYNLLKTDIKPMDYLKIAKRQDSGLYLLTDQKRTKHGTGTISHQLLPVYLAGVLGLEESIDHDSKHYMLIKRSLTGIPTHIPDEKTGKKTELNFSLALIAGKRPDFMAFDDKSTRRLPSTYCPAGIVDKERVIPIIDLEVSLNRFTDRFCQIYPELSQYYPFSKDFKYKESDGF